MRGTVHSVMAPRAEIVINGDDVYEDLLGVSARLWQLTSEAGFATTRHLGMWRFDSPLCSPDVYVLYPATGEFTVAQQLALARRVRSGAGLLALHTANVFSADATGAVTEAHQSIWQLVGSRYMGQDPSPDEPSRILLNQRHAITRGLSDFYIAHERYRIQLADHSARILAMRQTSGSPEPVLYIRREGAGRVCYLQLGHDTRVWDEPTARTLFTRSLSWCAARDSGAALGVSDDEPKW